MEDGARAAAWRSRSGAGIARRQELTSAADDAASAIYGEKLQRPGGHRLFRIGDFAQWFSATNGPVFRVGRDKNRASSEARNRGAALGKTTANRATADRFQLRLRGSRALSVWAGRWRAGRCRDRSADRRSHKDWRSQACFRQPRNIRDE